MITFAAIIPHYNAGARMGESLASLLAQSRPYDEILILDDGSTDDSVAVIERMIAGNPRIKLVCRTQNRGVVATLNEGLQLIESEYVHMASANDTYHPRLLEYCERALGEHPGISLFCGNATFRYANPPREMPVSMHIPQTPHYIPATAFHAYVRQSPLTFFGGGIVMRRQAVRDVDGLQEPLRWHADWMLYYLLALEHGVYFMPEALVNIEITDHSYSSQAMIWQRQRSVIQALIDVLARHYPDMKERWKSAALLPTYDLRACVILFRAECRWYATPLLLWRLLIHSVAYRAKYVLPRSLLLRLRTVFRV